MYHMQRHLQQAVHAALLGMMLLLLRLHCKFISGVAPWRLALRAACHS